MLKLLCDGPTSSRRGVALAMAFGAAVKEETVRERGARLSGSVTFWLDQAREHLVAGDSEAALEMTLKAEENLRLLRKHTVGGVVW